MFKGLIASLVSNEIRAMKEEVRTNRKDYENSYKGLIGRITLLSHQNKDLNKRITLLENILKNGL